MAGQTAIHGLGLAAWDGVSWQNLGGGTGAVDGFVSALAVYNGDLIAAGPFLSVGGVAANGIARYNRATGWRPLGTGMVGPHPYVETLTVYNGDLIAGGEFISAGGVAVNYIARWTDDPAGGAGQWRAVATGGLTTQTGYQLGVWALATYHGDLIIGGSFGYAFFPTPGIARWNGVPGSQWIPMNSNSGLHNGTTVVYDLAVWNGKLYLAGEFGAVSNVPAANIISWDGTTWEPLGSGLTGGPWTPHAFGLTTFNNELVAVGGFATAGGTTVNGVARWNGERWASFADGLANVPRGFIYAAAPFQGQLAIVGQATDQSLPYWSRWGCLCPPDFNGSDGLNAQDIFDFLSAWFASDPRADFNGLNGITTQDIFDFLAAWFAGC